MAQDLAQLLNLDQTQQMVQGNYAQALRDKREWQKIAGNQAGDFSRALSKDNPVALNPADVFNAYQSFNAAVKPALTADQDILTQLVELARQRENNQLTQTKMKQDQSNADRNYNLEATKAGLTVDPKSGKLIFKPETDINGNTIPRGSDAIAEVNKQGGSEFLKGGTVGERAAIAEEILKMGGVTAYRKQLPLDTLLSSTERAEIGSQTDLLSLIDRSIPGFAQDKIGGTGPLAQFIPGFIRSEEGRDNLANINNLSAQYKKAISGATVSEPEAKRLEAFLPTNGKTESQNLQDLQRLKTGILINQELFALSRQEKLTPMQSYKKYGADVFAKYGETMEGDKNPKAGLSPTSGGYVIEEVK